MNGLEGSFAPQPIPFKALRYGDVVFAHNVWSEDGRARGNHPVVILTPTAEICSAQALSVVCVTTSPRPRSPIGPSYLPMPWDKDGDLVTGLTAECWAACHWMEELYAEDAMRKLGETPPLLLKAIEAKVIALRTVVARRP